MTDTTDVMPTEVEFILRELLEPYFLDVQHGTFTVENSVCRAARMVAGSLKSGAHLSVAVSESEESQPVAWRELDLMIGPGHCLPMLVCRKHPSASCGPALAFIDVGSTWRVVGSHGGSAPLAWMPTHCAPAPSIWPLKSRSEHNPLNTKDTG